jgi:hypothetical protein
MPDFDLSRLIVDALDDPSPQESVFRVKTAVANELAALDPTAIIKATNHFNHTFAPDFVLTWRDRLERNVFLRLTEDIAWLSDDVNLIESNAPLVLDLAQRPLEQADVAALAEATRDKHAMISQPEALERLIDRRADDSTASMVSNALAQGGRGVFVGERAIDFAEAVAAGFTGASEVESESTKEAIGDITESLGEPQAWRMTRVLQAVWEGSSGRLDLFPGKADLSGRLNLDSLEYLLTYMESDDSEFWRRVGRGLTLGDITGLSLQLPNSNISRLIQANLDVISARASAVFDNSLGVDAATELAWGIRGGYLSLETPKFFAIVAETKKALEPKILSEQMLPSVNEFIERADGSDLEEVTLRSGSEVMTLRNEDGAIDGDRLTEVAATYTAATHVSNATARSASGRVTLDYATSSGTGHTRSRLLMADLLATTIPLMVSLDDPSSDALADFLAYEATPDDLTSVTLFDELEEPDDQPDIDESS